MIKVMLVEDEPAILHGMKSFVPWEYLGFEVTDLAEDALQALECCAYNEPDVIISDIKMPYMDGLELCEQVRRDYPDVYFVLLTGYDDFAYAQRALNKGAYQYLLKPLNKNELCQVLEQIRESILAKQEQSENFQKLENLAKQGSFRKKETLFHRLLSGMSTVENTAAELNECDIDLPGKSTVVLLMEAAPTGDGRTRKETYGVLQNTLEQHMHEDKNGISLTSYEQDMEIICLWRESDQALEAAINQLVPTIRKKLDEHDIGITVGISARHTAAAAQLHEAYEEAVQALEKRFFVGMNQTIYYQSQLGEKQLDQLLALPTQLSKHMDFTNKESIELAIQQLFTSRKAGMEDSLCDSMITSNIIMYAIQALSEAGLEISQVMDQPHSRIREILNAQTVEIQVHRLKKLLFEIMDILNENCGNNTYQIISTVKNYIAEHYMQKRLSLAELAGLIPVSTGYLSLVFKRETGLTVVDYLTQVRLDKAKYLLQFSNYKVFEIADHVGYDNTTYFSTLFKKYCDLSPCEYRSWIKQQRAEKA